MDSGVLSDTAHRPWPLPKGPWMGYQHWDNLLFHHYEVSGDHLRGLVPAALEIDDYQGSFWITVVAFEMSHVRLRFLPPLPGLNHFPELNLRTYVFHRSCPEKKGIYLFSLETTSLLALAGGHLSFGVNYRKANMKVEVQKNEVSYSSKRRTKPLAQYQARYRSISKVEYATPESLSHWLTERYAVYTVIGSSVTIGEVHHRQWPLQKGSLDLKVERLCEANGFKRADLRPRGPVHFSKKLEVFAWPPKKIA